MNESDARALLHHIGRTAPLVDELLHAVEDVVSVMPEERTSGPFGEKLDELRRQYLTLRGALDDARREGCMALGGAKGDEAHCAVIN